MSDMKAKLHTGELYFPGDEESKKGRRLIRICYVNIIKLSRQKWMF